MVEVNGQSVQATIDTGATVTILSRRFYQKLGGVDDQGAFSVKLGNAKAGQNMDAKGGVLVKMRIGNCTLDWSVYAAPIRDDVLLGLDFLRAGDVTIRARGALYVGPQKVRSQLVNHTTAYGITPVRLMEAVILEPQTEYILWGANEDAKPDGQG